MSVEVSGTVRGCIAGKREDGRGNRRRDGGSAKHKPSARVKGVVDRDARIRIGDGRGVGLRALGATCADAALEARLRVDLAAAAAGARPRFFATRVNGG